MIRYFSGYVIAGLVGFGLLAGGIGIWVGPILLFIVHPMMDCAIGRAQVMPQPQASNKFNLILPLAVITVTVFLWFGVLPFANAASNVDKLGVLLSVGLITGLIGIATAHELIHRNSEWWRWAGYIILWQVCFGHWAVEHVHCHHKHVGTPQDPATPRKGEWLFLYWPRTYFHGMWNAWLIEKQRLKNASAWKKILSNKVILSWTSQIGIGAVFFWVWGVMGLVYYLGQSAVAILLLKTVDYIEHYGLVRHKRENGLYEPVRDEHSWDCDYRLTNWTVVNLGYHAHHHRKPLVEYQNLVTAIGHKRMPLGYSGMVLLAFVPPLYFHIMDEL